MRGLLTTTAPQKLTETQNINELASFHFACQRRFHAVYGWIDLDGSNRPLPIVR